MRPRCLLLFFSLTACGDADPPVSRTPPAGDATFIENHPGDLIVTSPERGAFIPETAGDLVVVAGKGDPGTVIVDGTEIETAADGSFTTTVPARPGVGIVRVEQGEDVVDTAFLYGAFSPAEERVPRAIALRINDKGFTQAGREPHVPRAARHG